MSYKDVKNLISQKGSISLNMLNSALERNKANEETINAAQSIFTYLDKNGDGKINAEEWENINQDYERLDANQDGVVSDEEIINASDNSIFKIYGSKLNDFANYITEVLIQDAETLPKPEEIQNSDSGLDSECKNPDLQSLQIKSNSIISKTYVKGSSKTDLQIYSDGNGFETDICNFTPNNNDNYNVKRFTLINNDNNLLGHASYIINGQDKLISYGVNFSNVSITEFDSKKLNISANAQKEVEYKSEEQNTKIEYGAAISLEKLNLSSTKEKINNKDASTQCSAYTFDADIKNIGNIDATHTLTRQNGGLIITDTQNIVINDNNISADFKQEKSDKSGNKYTKKANTLYSTEQKNVNIELSRSSEAGGRINTSSVSIDSGVEELNTHISYNNSSEDNYGNSEILNLSTGYNETLGLKVNHTKVKKQDDCIISNTQTVNFDNNVLSLSLTNNDSGNNGNINNKSADASYNAETKVVNLNLSKDAQDDKGNKSKSLNLSSNANDFVDAQATFRSAITDEGGTVLSIEHEIVMAVSSDGESEARYRIDKTQTIVNEQGEAVEQNKSNELGVHYNKEEKLFDLHYSGSRVENGELQSSLDINGILSEHGGEASVRAGKLNKHKRMVHTEVAANASDEEQRIGLKFKRSVHNTSSVHVEEGKKPKKSKSLYIKADISKSSTKTEDYNELGNDYYSDNYSGEEPLDDGYEEYGDESYGEYDSEDSLSQDYDYSDGIGSTSNSGTDVDVKAKYRVGNDAVSAETHNLKGGRVGYSHTYRNKNKGTSGNASAFAEYNDGADFNVGVGLSRVKRDENGKLKNAAAASVGVNPSNGDITAIAGYAAPLNNKKKEQVGNISTYAQYSSKDKSVTVGGQMSGIVYKKNNKEKAKDNAEEDDLLLNSSEFQENNQDVEEMENIGQYEIIDGDAVNDDLNDIAGAAGERQVAAGYHVKAEIGHASDRDPAVQYNIDAQGFINTNIAGKDSTIYGRVTSTNGILNEVENIYGRQINNPVQSTTYDVATGHENMEKYRDASFKENEISETNNITTAGIGVVIGNPEEIGTNYAGAANLVLEDGKVTQFTVMGKGEYVYSVGDNRQSIGTEAIYSINKNCDVRNLTVDLYYDNTFNNNKTRINAGIGYAQDAYEDNLTNTTFVSLGAKQQIVKKVDIYGQFEFGQIKGCGSTEQTSDTYTAARLGLQYHFSQNVVVFGEYNTGFGSAMSQSRMIPQSEKDRFKLGCVTFGIGMRF